MGSVDKKAFGWDTHGYWALDFGWTLALGDGYDRRATCKRR